MTNRPSKTNLPTTASGSGGKQFYAALASWSPSEMVPEAWTRDRLTHAAQRLRVSLRKPLPAEWAVQMDYLLDFAETFGVKIQDRDAALAIYRETLADVPPDLLARAVTSVKASWKWGNRLPMPTEILEHIRGDWFKRRQALTKAEMALKRLPPPRPDPDPDMAERAQTILSAG